MTGSVLGFPYKPEEGEERARKRKRRLTLPFKVFLFRQQEESLLFPNNSVCVIEKTCFSFLLSQRKKGRKR
jgi:hypothetical protein